jgi:hypothetical protein
MIIFKVVIQNEGDGGCNHSEQKLDDIISDTRWKGKKISEGFVFTCKYCGQVRRYIQQTERTKL